MKFKLLFIFTLLFSSLPLCAMDHPTELDAELAEAAQAGNSKEVESCLLRGANPNTTTLLYDDWGEPETITPLIIASKKGFTKIVKLLLDHHANVDAQDITKNTALIIAALYGHTTIVNILLKYSADIKIKNADGETALCHSDANIVELLLNHINHVLDKTDDVESWHMWDLCILDALSVIERALDSEEFLIKYINAFRMFLHHASKLPLSTKKLESLTSKVLGHRYDGERAFRKTIKHLRKNAF